VSSYSIDRNTDLERFFNVDALSGVISTAKPLDREANSVHNLTLLAIESREYRRGHTELTESRHRALSCPPVQLHIAFTVLVVKTLRL
jgi:hypothetical protein